MPVYYTQEDIDANDMDPDLLDRYNEIGTDLNYESAKNNVACELEANGWNNINECTDDRYYITTLFSEKTESIIIGDVCIDVTVRAGFTPGYYQAANFDWLAKVEVNGMIDGWHEQFEYEADELEPGDVIRDNWYDNIGLSKIHAVHIINKIEAIIDSLKNEAELAFSKYCEEETYCTFRSFNGEAGYSAVSKRLYKEIEERNKKNA